ncbi:MAG: 16S rRNA (guanine(966)-N(2))-methyltransferase RsmD [Alphaproteobacteria bacterium]
MRIIGGAWRGRTLTAPAGTAVRPTSDRVREALFNVLLHRFDNPPLAGARVLDAFAGSGAMGLEALSRGAVHATFLDQDQAALMALRNNLQTLKVREAASVLAHDVCRPPPAAVPCTFAFLDPPYDRDVAGMALAKLAATGWLAMGALCSVELRAGTPLPPPDGFTCLDQRTWGPAAVVFLRWKG